MPEPASAPVLRFRFSPCQPPKDGDLKRVSLNRGWCFAAMVLVLGCFLALLLTPNLPSHAGRPISAWFHDLCAGVYGGTSKAAGWDAAYAAFSEMEPDAVPYLTRQLRYDRWGVRQKIISFLGQYSLTKPLTRKVIWPVERRSYAAVALRQLGPKAETAIPALLESWAHDTPDVKVNALAALQSILNGRHLDGAAPAELAQAQEQTIAEAAGRYPNVAAELGIKIDPPQ